MAACKNPDCQYLANRDPTVSVGYCCEKCEGRHKGEDWAFGGKKKHTACCSCHDDPCAPMPDPQTNSFCPPANGNQNREKCANPDCEYERHSNPSVSLLYCCEKCEGVHKREPWAEGGKRHYKSCEKVVFTVRWGANWAPSVVEEREERKPLDRYAGAERDTRPAWMTQGVGINQQVFGETRGDLVKPGMTQADLDRLESKVRSRSPDPMGDFFNQKSSDPMASFFNTGTNAADRPRSRTPPRRAPLPDQREQYWARWE